MTEMFSQTSAPLGKTGLTKGRGDVVSMKLMSLIVYILDNHSQDSTEAFIKAYLTKPWSLSWSLSSSDVGSQNARRVDSIIYSTSWVGLASAIPA